MFNIWKHAWLGTDSKPNTNDAASPDAQEEEFISGEQVAAWLSKRNSKVRKHSPADDDFTSIEHNKKPRYDTPTDNDLKIDSVANYLPEVLAKPPPQNNQVDRPAIKSTIEDVFDHLKRANSK